MIKSSHSQHLISSNIVSIDSKNQLKLLYLRYKKEIEEKIFSGESKLPTRINDSDYELRLTAIPSGYYKESFEGSPEDGYVVKLGQSIYRTTDLEEIIKKIYLEGEGKNAKIC